MHIELQERDDVLLKRSARGDEEAFTQLYRRNQAQIYRFALRMTGHAWAAEEIVQDVFMTLVREPKKYDPTRGPLGAFLYGIARNRVMKHLERLPREFSLEVKNSEGEAMMLDVADGVSRNRGSLRVGRNELRRGRAGAGMPNRHGAFQVAPGTRVIVGETGNAARSTEAGECRELRICGRSENELRRICHRGAGSGSRRRGT